MKNTLLISTAAVALLAGAAFAEGDHAITQDGAILSDKDAAKRASFDSLAAHAHRAGNGVTVHMTTADVAGADQPQPVGAQYDAVTSALRVNANIHAPLLCVTDVFDVASGDLTLPGIVK